MSPSAGLVYVGGALAWAIALSAAAALAAATAGRPLSRRAWALLLAALFPVFLGLHPFPDPATLDCGLAGRAPRLRPFGFVADLVRAWTGGGSWREIAGSLSILPPILNVVLFMPAGAALAHYPVSARTMPVFALGLSGFIETAQLSGVFGIYDCSYRQFDVDDLILNVAGVALGFGAARYLRRPSAPS